MGRSSAPSAKRLGPVIIREYNSRVWKLTKRLVEVPVYCLRGDEGYILRPVLVEL